MARLLALAREDPEACAREMGRVCPYCGRVLTPQIVQYELPWGKQPHLSCPDECGCPGERLAALQGDEAAEAARKHAEEETYSAELRAAGLSGSLVRCTFDAFEVRADWPASARCLQTAKAYADALMSGELRGSPHCFLVLAGNIGTGKTHLAAATVRRALDTGWKDCFFRPWGAMLKEIQASWHEPAGPLQRCEDAILREVRMGQLVALDDIDKKRGTPWAKETLFPIIDERVREMRPTILTFNAPLFDENTQLNFFMLEPFVGPATLDRIVGATFAIVDFPGPSYRSGAEFEQEEIEWHRRKDAWT